MKKNLLLLTAFLFLASSAQASSTRYFSTSGNNANIPTCSQGSPCHHIAGTSLAAASAYGPGDKNLLKRGDEWTGSQAEFSIDGSGTLANRVVTGAYGTGANPVLAGAAATTVGWTNTGVNNTWSLAGQSQSHLYTVTQDDTKGLFRCATSCTTTTLVEGSYILSGTTLYVRLWGNVAPATHTVRVGSFAQFASDGARGLLRTADVLARANYQDFKDITIIASNGVGFSISGAGDRSLGLNIIGSGWDGWLCYHIEGAGGECSDFADYYSEISYGVTAGPGHGQGLTAYGGPRGVIVGTYSHDNAMAGEDFLDFSSATNVTEVVLLRTRAINNSLSPDDAAFDANIYFDGASEGLAYGNIAYGGGGPRNNSRPSTRFGSEHPTSKPAQNLYLLNNLLYGTKWVGFDTAEICFGVTECPPDGATKPNKIKNIYLVNNTIASTNFAGFNMTTHFQNPDTTVDNWVMRNNVLISKNTATDEFMNAGSYLDADNNLYYKRGNASTSTTIYNTCNGCSGVAVSLAGWRTLTGEDDNSIYGDPKLVLDADDATMDAHLQAGSPAFNAGYVNPVTLPAWLPATIAADIGSCGVKGTTVAAGTLDTCATLDIGFHYDYAGLTSTSIVPASLVASDSGNATITFTMPDKVTALLYNWKVKATLPTGFSWNSGGTTAVSSSTITGTWTVSVSGQDATFTRVGDGESEFPGTYNMVVSNVGNPSTPGSTGTFAIETQNSSGTKIAQDPAVAAVTISSSSSGSGGHFACTKTTIKGGARIA